jgi:cytochrome P450
MLTRRDDIYRSVQMPEVFSSRSCIPTEPDPPYQWIPVMTDPPEHTKFRRLLLPQFSASRVDDLTPTIRRRCIEVLEGIAARGSCDLVADFALRYPTSTFMELMGFPAEDFEQIMHWEHTILYADPDEDPDRQRAIAATFELYGYLAELRRARMDQPQDDLMTYLLGCMVDEEPLSELDWSNICLTLFLAGLDTVAAQLSYTFFHLATHPDDRERIVRDPAMIPNAVEEALRYYTVLSTARKLTRDIDIHGCPLRAGDMVAMPYAAANRDPDAFPDAGTFDIDRPVGRHMGFGGGPHRCLGSHLGRREVQVALEEWHKRIPRYRLADGVTVMEHGGPVLGIESLPLEWDASE